MSSSAESVLDMSQLLQGMVSWTLWTFQNVTIYNSSPFCMENDDMNIASFIRNRTSNTEIGRSKTGWGAAETGFVSPISVLQVLV